MIRKAVAEALQSKNSVMFITAIIFMCGILSFFNDNATLTAFVFTVLGLVALYKNYISVKYVIFWIITFYAGFFLCGFKIHFSDDLVTYAPAKTTITGQIISIPNSNVKNRTRFFVKVLKKDNVNINAKVLVTVRNDAGDFSEFVVGDTYQFYGKLMPPYDSTNPSQFDYAKYLRNFDVFTTFYSDIDDVKRTDTKIDFKWKFFQKLNKLRSKILCTHSQYLKSPEIEILGGIVFGDDAVAPPDYIKNSFVNSGLLHILAASGMNVAFIYGFWFFFMRKMRMPFQFSVISGILIIILYTMMTGLGPSVIRAALMLIIILIGKLIDRDTHSVSLLALVALLMLIYNPAYINDVGFQLSFLVTFGLLTTGSTIFEKLKDTKIPEWLSAALLIPIIAQIWVAPIQMFYFNTFSLYSVLANILSVSFLSFVSFGGFISSIFAAFTPYTKYICMVIDYFLNYLLNIIVWISNFFASLPHSIIITPHPNVLQILLYYLIILALTFAIKLYPDKEMCKKILYSTAVIFLLLAVSMLGIPNKKLEIITFDVKNADCFLVKTPRNKYFIIDTGRTGYGKFTQANLILIKYMRDRGLKNVEGMILTHFDNDHSGGAYEIMKNLNVKKVYINSYNDESHSAYYVYKGLKQFNVKSELPKNNNVIYSENDLKIKTYYANLDYDSIKNVNHHENENSIITLIQYKDFDMLFMGDAGIKAFNKVKDKIPSDVEVLKVGHHGGPQVVDKEMLSHLKNKVSIISTGTNEFGHPNKGTIDVLRNTDIYRTDRHNSIKISTDGKTYDVFNYDKILKKYVKSSNYKSF